MGFHFVMGEFYYNVLICYIFVNNNGHFSEDLHTVFSTEVTGNYQATSVTMIT
jgi:hypothetical protein